MYNLYDEKKRRRHPKNENRVIKDENIETNHSTWNDKKNVIQELIKNKIIFRIEKKMFENFINLYKVFNLIFFYSDCFFFIFLLLLFFLPIQLFNNLFLNILSNFFFGNSMTRLLRVGGFLLSTCRVEEKVDKKNWKTSTTPPTKLCFECF